MTSGVTNAVAQKLNLPGSIPQKQRKKEGFSGEFIPLTFFSPPEAEQA